MKTFSGAGTPSPPKWTPLLGGGGWLTAFNPNRLNILIMSATKLASVPDTLMPHTIDPIDETVISRSFGIASASVAALISCVPKTAASKSIEYDDTTTLLPICEEKTLARSLFCSCVSLLGEICFSSARLSALRFSAFSFMCAAICALHSPVLASPSSSPAIPAISIIVDAFPTLRFNFLSLIQKVNSTTYSPITPANTTAVETTRTIPQQSLRKDKDSISVIIDHQINVRHVQVIIAEMVAIVAFSMVSLSCADLAWSFLRKKINVFILVFLRFSSEISSGFVLVANVPTLHQMACRV